MYIFRTNHFGLTSSELHLMRSKFAYKKIALSEIEHIELTKYFGTKHPVMLSIFGLILYSLCFWFVTNESVGFGTKLSETADIFQAARGYGYIISGLLFLIGLGTISLIQVFKLRWTLKIKFINKSWEMLPITEIQKNNKTEELINYLIKNFDSTQFRFHKDLIKSI